MQEKSAAKVATELRSGYWRGYLCDDDEEEEEEVDWCTVIWWYRHGERE